MAAFAGGAISGGAFNPAVGIGPALVGAVLGGGTLVHIWLYLVGPLAGGALAAALFRVQNPEEAAQAIPAPPPGENPVRAGDYSPPLTDELPRSRT